VSARVFAGPPAPGAPVVLDADESHYLRRVRRLSDGDPVELIDDAGELWSATVAGGDARRSRLVVHARLPAPAPARELVLLLGLPDPAAALELLPAVVELGVAAVAWVRLARSQAGPPGDARLARVVRAAQRQCGRPRPPAFHGPTDLAGALELRTDLPGFFAWEAHRGQPDPDPAPLRAPGARLCVGPEGGFTDAEAEALARAGFTPLGLGPYTLRTPTAAVVGLARLLFAPRT
jgi:16S rRNA (uracil1498-N3)-methyltransferase